MENKRVLTLVIGLFVGLAMALNVLIQPCFAGFSLLVTPYEGGYDLRFGTLDTQSEKAVKEFTISITTDIGKQYRVYQRLDKALATPDGVEIDRNQFKMYTLTNSNSRGTLEWIEENPVMSSDTVLYTSNTAGEGDSFKVEYTLEPSINQVAGSYYGRFIFILVPIDSTQEQVTQTLNIYADLSNEGAVEITTETGSNYIRISSEDLEKDPVPSQDVGISVKGNLGTRYSIYQQLNNSLLKAGSSVASLDLTKVVYKVVDKDLGVIIKEGSLADLKSKALIYASDDLGSAKDIIVEYQPVADFPSQKADVYRGMINYSLELDKSTAMLESGFIDSVDIECDVEPVFKITASSLAKDGTIIQEGLTFLQFGEVGYKEEMAKENKINVKIESNLEKPY
ncbi:MAG: hypothetical protein PHG69_03585, partial [Candidatus Omnitrophica bacterium]|nr:hypothetical protein [Candidatus Omnitrophota bacterium]